MNEQTTNKRIITNQSHLHRHIIITNDHKIQILFSEFGNIDYMYKSNIRNFWDNNKTSY